MKKIILILVVLASACFSFTTVSEVPVVTGQSGNILVAPGDPGVFTVTVESAFAVTYQWYHGAQPDTSTPVGVDSDTLTIASVAKADEGFYYCVVTSVKGTATSADDRLYVKQRIAYYPLDTDTDDYSGNGYHAEFVYGTVDISVTDANQVPDTATAVLTTGGGGIKGEALELDGAGGHIRTITEAIAAALEGNTEISISAWVESNSDATDKGYISLHTPHGSDDGGMRYDVNGSDHVQKMGIRTTLGEHAVETSFLSQRTVWQHVVMTWKSGSNIKVYIDGVADTLSEVGSTANQDRSGGVLEGSGDHALATLFIGRGGKEGGVNVSWDGKIDEVEIFNYALSPLQVASNSTLTSGEPVCFAPPALDVNGDCIQNLYDFVDWAATYGDCNRVPDCISIVSIP